MTAINFFSLCKIFSHFLESCKVLHYWGTRHASNFDTQFSDKNMLRYFDNCLPRISIGLGKLFRNVTQVTLHFKRYYLSWQIETLGYINIFKLLQHRDKENIVCAVWQKPLVATGYGKNNTLVGFWKARKSGRVLKWEDKTFVFIIRDYLSKLTHAFWLICFLLCSAILK